MAVDADTKKALEEAKKGKPRRFVMVCKGAKILSLVVYKKGSLDKYKKQAKEEGTGQLYHGVIDGKGANLSFKLLRGDGFEQPPGKDLVLKTFLSDEADMQLKPVYEIVDVLPDVPEDDNELAPQTQPSSTSEQTVANPTASTLADDFKKRLSLLVPQIKDAAETPSGLQAKAKVTEAADLARREDYAQANVRLDEVESLLKSVASSGQSATTPDPGVAFNERLKELLPKIKAAAGTPAGDQTKLKASEAGMFARSRDFAKANALLDQIASFLDQSTGVLSSAGGAVSAAFPKLWEQASAAWTNAIESVDSQLDKLRTALLQEGDSELKEIAEYGLNAITGNHKVPLQAAMLDVKLAGGNIDAKTIAKTKEMIDEFRDHIETDEQVEACDENPFGVKVNVRSTLGPALDAMDSALNQAFV